MAFLGEYKQSREIIIAQRRTRPRNPISEFVYPMILSCVQALSPLLRFPAPRALPVCSRPEFGKLCNAREA